MTEPFASADCLTLDGALTIRTADAVCAALRIRLEAAGDIRIDCQAATDVDLSFVQILLAAHLSARDKSRAVRLARAPDGPLLDTLTRAGFDVIGDGDAGFWFEPAAAA